MPTHTILIVDDEANLRLTLCAVLQKAGYSVTAVGHAQDALASLTAGPQLRVLCQLLGEDSNFEPCG